MHGEKDGKYTLQIIFSTILFTLCLVAEIYAAINFPTQYIFIGIFAVLAGLLAAVAGGGGLKLLTTTTELIPALIIGTMVGVIAFKGVAVGPLIAGGFTYFVMSLMTHFR